MQPIYFRTSRLIAIAFAAALGATTMTASAQAQDKPAAPAAAPAAAAPAGDAAKPAEAKPADAKPADATPQDGKKKKKKAAAATQSPRSLEARHQVCLAFIQRHGLSCDPWVEPTCGAETGYFRPLECVRPRSQQ